MVNSWIPISIGVAVVLCVIVLIIALRIYRPHARLNTYTGLAGVVLIVGLLAAVQVASSYEHKTIDKSYASEIYMLADSLGEDSSLQALQLIKRAWEEHPSADRKWLLGLAYLNDAQTDRAYRLLQEAAQEAKHADWFEREQAEELLQVLERYRADLAEITDDPEPRDVTGMETGAGASNRSGMQIARESGARITSEMIQAVALEGAPPADAAETGNEADAANIPEAEAGGTVTDADADTGSSDDTLSEPLLEAFEPLDMNWEEIVYDETRGAQLAARMEEAEEAYRNWIQAAVEQIQERAANGSDLPVSELEWLAELDLERLQFADATGDGGWRQAYDEAMTAAFEQQIESPLLRRVLASAALYMNDDSMAEGILVQLLIEYPEDEETAAMLSELYLSGRIHPGDEARQLPHYPIAEQRAERAWLDIQRGQENTSGEPGSQVSEGVLGSIEEALADELAYTIVAPLVSETSSFKLDARLARYYYNSGDLDQAAEMIGSMTQKTEQMSIGEQRTLQQVEQQEELVGADILDESKRQAQIQAREDVFRIMHAPRQSWDPTMEDSGFAYYMQEQLRLPERQNIVITSIDTDEESGQVTLYVRAENLDELNRSNLTLTDNGAQIADYAIEKIGQAEHHTRSIGIVIDVSGSMSGERIEAAKAATSQFVQSLKGFEQAELVAFSDSPSLVQEMTSDIGALQAAASSLVSDGGTNITAALQYELGRIASISGQRVVFIFTDGEDSEFSMPESRARIVDLANGIGTPVFAVGFGAGYDTLSEVAEATGGQFIAATNTATIMNGFADVAKTLERTYTVTYKLEPMEQGIHTVELMKDSLSSEKQYLVGGSESFGDGGGTEDVQRIETDDRYMIQQVLPGTVQLDQSAGAVITLDGLGLALTDKVKLGKLTIGDFTVKDGGLQFRLPRDLKEGKYTITIRAEDGRESQAELQVLAPGMMQSVKFGWATVYGRWIEAGEQEVRITGNSSVDHFLYTSGSSDEMVLTGGKELSFEGLHIAVDRTQLPFVGQLAVRGQQASDKLIHPRVTMKLMDYGEFFRLSYGGADRLTFRRMGLEFAVMDLSYYALKSEGAGRLETKMGLSGWNTVAKAAGNMKLLQSIRFPNIPDAQITARFQPDNLMLRGDVTLQSIGYQSMFNAKGANLGVEYEFKPNRLLLTGGFDQIEVLGRELAAGPIKGGKITLGWENGTLPKAYGVTVTGNGIPLGTTGLTVNKFGILLDFTSAKQGSLEVGLGTVVDKVRPFIEKLNRLSILGYKPFDFDPDKVSLLGLDANLGVKKFLSSDWEASGSATAKVFGFKVAERSFRLNRNLIEFGARFDLVLLMDGKLTIMYSDPSKSNHLTIGQIGKVTGPFIDVQMRWLVVPARISDSAYSFHGKAGGFDVNYHMGEFNVYR